MNPCLPVAFLVTSLPKEGGSNFSAIGPLLMILVLEDGSFFSIDTKHGHVSL